MSLDAILGDLQENNAPRYEYECNFSELVPSRVTSSCSLLQIVRSDVPTRRRNPVSAICIINTSHKSRRLETGESEVNYVVFSVSDVCAHMRVRVSRSRCARGRFKATRIFPRY